MNTIKYVIELEDGNYLYYYKDNKSYSSKLDRAAKFSSRKKAELIICRFGLKGSVKVVKI